MDNTDLDWRQDSYLKKILPAKMASTEKCRGLYTTPFVPVLGKKHILDSSSY